MDSVRVTGELLAALKGCGLVTVTATEDLMNAGVSVPLGAAVWAPTINQPVPIEDILQQARFSQTGQTPAPVPPQPGPAPVPPQPRAPSAPSVMSADDGAT